MKRFIFLLTTIFICTIAYSETRSLNWYNGDNAYSQTTCEIGGDLDVPITAPTKYGYDFVGWDIQSAKMLDSVSVNANSLQYFDTGVLFDGDEIEYDFKMAGTMYYNNIFGAAESCKNDTGCSTNNATGVIGGAHSNTIVYKAGNTRRLLTFSYGNTAHTYKLIIKKSSKQAIFSVDGNEEYIAFSGTPVSDHTIYIGGINCESISQYCFGSGAFYYFRIKKDGVLVLDLVPAMDPNGIRCFYDRISQTFLYMQSALK